MTTFFGYVAPGELAPQHDPVRVLQTALTEAALRTIQTYDPDHVSLWSKAAIKKVIEPNVQVTNLRSGHSEPACVCQMET
jgi:hypothetical protein